MKKKIFIDFDGTLFDTGLLKKDFFTIFARLGFSNEEILANYKSTGRDGKFEPDRMVDRLNSLHSFDTVMVKKEIDRAIESCGCYLYSDSVPFLLWLDREIFEVNLMTYGDVGFQKCKVSDCGIEKYFDNLYYVDLYKKVVIREYIQKNEDFIFVDNNDSEVFEMIEEFPDSLCIKIVRSDEDKDDPFLNRTEHKLQVVRNFDEVKRVIDREIIKKK